MFHGLKAMEPAEIRLRPACDYLTDHTYEPIYLDKICARLGLPPEA